MKKKIMILILCATLVNSTPVFAGEGTAGDYASAMGRQLGRGLLNIVTSPADIPCTMSSEISEKGAATGTFTGFGKGLWYMVRRIIVGVSEVGTFFLPDERTIPAVCRKQ